MIRRRAQPGAAPHKSHSCRRGVRGTICGTVSSRMKSVIRQLIDDNLDATAVEPPLTMFAHTSRLNELLSDIAVELHHTGESKNELMRRIDELYTPSVAQEVDAVPDLGAQLVGQDGV